MKYNVIERIKKFIDEHEVLRDYETYEQMPTFYRYKELDCLKSSIKEEYYIPFLINLAIMYVNQGLLLAKSQLTEEELKNYLIYFGIWWDEEEVEEMGFSCIDVYFTRKAKEHIKLFNTDYCRPIDCKDTKIYKYVKDIIGISEFTCYHSKWTDKYEDGSEEVSEFYFFIPKILEQQIKSNK
ncbi:Immunity protein 15 [Prevotellaceae bacterium HUN156]|nr:Immunity protein 15 [Prevotellaceae bacterium HUN156]